MYLENLGLGVVELAAKGAKARILRNRKQKRRERERERERERLGACDSERKGEEEEEEEKANNVIFVIGGGSIFGALVPNSQKKASPTAHRFLLH